MTAFTLVTPPVVEPVTLSEMKTQARVDTDADDTLIAALITAARQWAERFTGRAFIAQTWRLWLDVPPESRGDWWDGVREGALASFMPAASVVLPRPPLMSVSSVQVFGDDDVGVVWPSAHYFVDTARQPGRLALRSGAVWPVPQRAANGLMIEYVAGYGNDGAAVPEPIRLAIRQLGRTGTNDAAMTRPLRQRSCRRC